MSLFHMSITLCILSTQTTVEAQYRAIHSWHPPNLNMHSTHSEPSSLSAPLLVPPPIPQVRPPMVIPADLDPDSPEYCDYFIWDMAYEGIQKGFPPPNTPRPLTGPDALPPSSSHNQHTHVAVQTSPPGVAIPTLRGKWLRDNPDHGSSNPSTRHQQASLGRTFSAFPASPASKPSPPSQTFHQTGHLAPGLFTAGRTHVAAPHRRHTHTATSTHLSSRRPTPGGLSLATPSNGQDYLGGASGELQAEGIASGSLSGQNLSSPVRVQRTFTLGGSYANPFAKPVPQPLSTPPSPPHTYTPLSALIQPLQQQQPGYGMVEWKMVAEVAVLTASMLNLNLNSPSGSVPQEAP